MHFDLSDRRPCDLDRLVYTRLLIQSNSGGGKTWAVRRILEQTFGHIQHIVVDPEGEFSTLREKHDYVLVAATGGDVVASPRTAGLLARRLLELRASAILDIYDLRPADRVLFVKNFLEALVDAPKALWHPVLVVLDEAHVYCPEKGDAQSADAVKALASRGRKRGFCAVLATQRLSKLHKDTAAECINKLVGRTGLDVDLKRACDELGFRKDRWSDLQQLEPGNFYAYGPALSKAPQLIKVGPVSTSHPSQADRVALSPLAPPSEKVKALLSKLGDLPAEVEKKQQTEADLRQEVKVLKAALKVPAEPARIEVPAVTETQIKDLTNAAQRLVMAQRDISSVVEQLEAFGRDIIAALDRVVRSKSAHGSGATARQNPATIHVNIPTFLRSEVIAKSRQVATGASLTGPESAVLHAIAWWYEAGIEQPTQVAVAFKAGYVASGSSYRNARGHLNTLGLIRIEGKAIHLTDEGTRRVGVTDIFPTALHLQNEVRGMLSGPEVALLQPLIEHYPAYMAGEDLAEKSGYAMDGSSFRNARGHLRSLGLIVFSSTERGALRAASFLFLESA